MAIDFWLSDGRESSSCRIYSLVRVCRCSLFTEFLSWFDYCRQALGSKKNGPGVISYSTMGVSVLKRRGRAFEPDESDSEGQRRLGKHQGQGAGYRHWHWLGHDLLMVSQSVSDISGHKPGKSSYGKSLDFENYQNSREQSPWFTFLTISPFFEHLFESSWKKCFNMAFGEVGRYGLVCTASVCCADSRVSTPADCHP